MKWLLLATAWLACASPAPGPQATPPIATSVAVPAPIAPVPVIEVAPPPVDAARFEPTSFGVEVVGSGRPIIFIPGLGCPGAVWKATTEHLTHGELHTITAAGFAGRPPIDQPVMAAMRVELAEYIRERKLERPIIVGHSMGGFLALWLAEAEPELVGPVVVVDSAPTLGGGDPEWEPIARKQRDAYEAMSGVAFATRIRERFSPMFTDPKKHEAIITAVASSDPRAYSKAYYELNTIDLRPDVPKIQVPVLAILADTPSQKRIRALLAPIRNHRVVVVPRTRHFIMQDDPEAFYRVLEDFIAAHP